MPDAENAIQERASTMALRSDSSEISLSNCCHTPIVEWIGKSPTLHVYVLRPGKYRTGLKEAIYIHSKT